MVPERAHPASETYCIQPDERAGRAVRAPRARWLRSLGEAFELAFAAVEELFARSERLTARVLRGGFAGVIGDYRRARRSCERAAARLCSAFFMCRRELDRWSRGTGPLHAGEALFRGGLSIQRTPQIAYPYGVDGAIAREVILRFRTLSRAEREAVRHSVSNYGLADAAAFLYKYALVLASCANLFFFGELCLTLFEQRGRAALRGRSRSREDAALRRAGELTAALAALHGHVAAERWTEAAAAAAALRRGASRLAPAVAVRLAELSEARRRAGSAAMPDVERELALSDWLRRLGLLRSIGFHFGVVARAGRAGHEDLFRDEVRAARSLPFDSPDGAPRVSLACALAREGSDAVRVRGRVEELRSHIEGTGGSRSYGSTFTLVDPESGARAACRSNGHLLADNGVRDGAYFEAVVQPGADQATGERVLVVADDGVAARRSESWLLHARFAVRGLWDGFMSSKDANATYDRAPRDLVPERPSPWEREAIESGEVNAQADILLGRPDEEIVYGEWRRACLELHIVLDRTVAALGSERFGGETPIDVTPFARQAAGLRDTLLRLAGAASRHLERPGRPARAADRPAA